jgi:tRNA threonylcarbamoyl adenosine modification protein YjeE
MSGATPQALIVSFRTEAETAAFGAWLGWYLFAGDAVLLTGPIGAGKTHLARALIQSRLGDAEAEVPSPTFTLVQTYDTGDVAIWHADLYRIGHPDEVVELGLDAAFQDAIVLVEWPERLGRWRPRDAIVIELSPRDDMRVARIEAGPRPDLIAALRTEWQARDA